MIITNKKKIITVILAAIPIIAGMAAIYNIFLKDIFFATKRIILPYKNEIENISKIDIGINIEFIESLFGKPTIINKLPDKADSQFNYVYYCKNQKKIKPVNLSKYTERIYANKSSFIRIITDAKNSVIFYAVTARVDDFNPPLPWYFYTGENDKTLLIGKMRFSDYDLLSLVAYFSDGSRWHSLYEEQYYFLGVDKYCFLGQSSSGHNFTEELDGEMINLKNKFACSDSDSQSRFGFNGTLSNRYSRNQWAGDIMEKITLSEVITLRSKAKPNTYAVGEEEGHDDLMRYLFQNPSGIGPDYNLTRRTEF